MATETTPEPLLLQQLRSTLAEKPPLCSGTLGLPLDSFMLYYGKGRDARALNLAGRSAEDVDALSDLEGACSAATFGRNQEAVLDESYRKAGKMDAGQFLPRLDVNDSQLVDIVRAGLLSGKKEKDTIKAELYNLNVYGKGAFFKAHKDTPRGQSMFGSLVVIFPTPHEGGEFVFRHDGEEWTIDAAKMLSAYVDTERPRLAYVAFFSDVEHEVLPVKSGHRVTITYNLYWATPPVTLSSELSVLYPRHSSQSNVKDVLKGLLDDPTFLPDGGTLGFALRHTYPFPSQGERDMPIPLISVAQWLKGSDAALFDAFTRLSLKPYLRLVHRSKNYERGVDVLLDQGVPAVSLRYDGTLEPAPGLPELEREVEEEVGKHISTKNVYWMTPPSRETGNEVTAAYVAYGNEPLLQYLYMTISLLVDIGRSGSRAE
ncbi:hypothetical protein C8Q80DRAFT_1347846 [Daedaleopsis nitida]|nr:hypothetical protein C8Q80DRAFT_1347846 [Daedaleopsis nitida]